MIKILNTPNVCSLTQNAMIFQVESTQFFPSEKIYPKLRLKFSSSLTMGFYFQFEFINPQTFSNEIIRFRTVDVYKNEGDIKHGLFTTVSFFTSETIKYLKRIKKLTSFYNIVFVANGQIDLVAKEAIKELIPINIQQNMSEGFSSFTFTIFSSYNNPSEREGYQLKALVYYNDPKRDFSHIQNFELINIQNVALDENARGLVDVSEIINGKIESEWDEIPIPPYIQAANPAWWFYTPNLRQYYVQFKEFWNNDPIDSEIESSILFASWGGISTDDEVIKDAVNHILTSNKFLTWIPSGKEINATQTDFLYFMNGNQEKPWRIKVKVYTSISTTTYTLGEILLKPFQTVGFFANIEKYIDNNSIVDLITLAPNEKVVKYEFSIYEKNLITNSYPIDPTDRFVYYYHNYCNKKYILYFNSFGYAETFSTQSNWIESINLSTSIASRGLQYNNSHLRSKNFIFSSQHQNSIVLESSILKREEARRLQSMINSTYTFILENKRWIPVLIETKKEAVWNNSEFTQSLELELLKANTNDRASFYDTLPNVIVEKQGYSLIFQLLLNGYDFKLAGDLSIFSSTGNLIKTLFFDEPNFQYKNVASANDWLTEALAEGVYNYSVSVQDNSDKTSILKGVFEVKYERFYFYLGGTGIKSFYLGKDDLGFAYNVYVKYNLDSTAASDTIIDIYPNVEINPNYTHSGYKKITITTPSFQDVDLFQSNNSSLKFINLDALFNLKNLNLRFTDITGTLYLNKLTKLQIVFLANSPITHIEIGVLKDLTYFHLRTLEDFTALALQDLIIQFWNFRKMYDHPVTITLQNMIAPNAETNDLINGMGIYLGDGLIQNNFTVTIS